MEYKRLKRKDNNNMNNESANSVSSKTPLDNSLTTSQTKNNELSTLSSTQINSFYSYNKIHLFNLIMFLKQINTQIEQATKLNNSYDELLSCSIDNKNAVSSSGGNMFKKKKMNSAKNVNINNTKYKKEMDDLTNFLKKELQNQITKMKIDNDQKISEKKRELDEKREELLSNNMFIGSNLEEEINYYQEEYNRIKYSSIESKESEQIVETAKENIEKYKEVKKYLSEEYYTNIIKEEKVDATLKHNSNPHSKVTNSKTTSANKKKEKLSLSTISSKKK